MALASKFQPSPQAGRQQVATVLTLLCRSPARSSAPAAAWAGPSCRRRPIEQPACSWRAFSKVSRAIKENPARVYARVRAHADVPKQELEEFRKLLRVP